MAQTTENQRNEVDNVDNMDNVDDEILQLRNSVERDGRQENRTNRRVTINSSIENFVVRELMDEIRDLRAQINDLRRQTCAPLTSGREHHEIFYRTR